VLDLTTGHLKFKQWIDGPFTGSKFLIRRDQDGRYYSLSTTVTEVALKLDPPVVDARNTLVLATSMDLLTWHVCRTVLQDDTGLSPADSAQLTGFEYPDWRFDGADILAAVRTAYKGAADNGSSNFETWLRVKGYRGSCAGE